MSIALPSLPLAAAPAALGPQPAAGAPATQNPAATNAQLPGFQSAWQRIALTGALPTSQCADAADTALAVAEDDSSTDTNATPGRPPCDLMLSGMLLPLSGLPIAQPDQSASLTLTAGASDRAATSAASSPASASVNKLGDSLAPIAPTLLAVAQTAAPAMASTPQASSSLLEKLVQNTASNAANTADSPAAAAALPTRASGAAASPALLAAASSDASRQQRSEPASRFAALDLQSLDGANITSAIDSTARAIQRSAVSQTPTASPTANAQKLLESLGERISLQLQRGSERAVIRLDPPLQGQLEITIRHDATGATQVHLSASNSDVVRQLQTLSDSLRQELVHRQAGEVTVLVAQSGRDQDGRQRQNPQTASQQAPGRALADDADAQSTDRFTLFPT
jgi:flagellar hook-length control protein FliK